MKIERLAAVALCLLPFLARGDDNRSHDHNGMPETTASSHPQITISINPEARVSATVIGGPPSSVSCGTPIDLPVSIVNQGFVTAVLEATLVDSIPSGASIKFSAAPLKGVHKEQRLLRVILQKPGASDITISFRPKHEAPDLGGRDRIHLILRCV